MLLRRKKKKAVKAATARTEEGEEAEEEDPCFPEQSMETDLKLNHAERGVQVTCVMVEQAEVVLHSSFLWSLCRLVRWRGFRTAQGTVLNCV